MTLQTFSDFKKIVEAETPLIDVRAPIEFEKGAFINAVNLPLMNDEERRLVGICYKEKGNEAAVQLGHELVQGEVKAQRVAAWVAHMEKYPQSMIYCFRGGMRSQISQQWLSDALGKEVLRLDGGYKAFRGFLIEALEPEHQKCQPVILGGCTGSGKTILIKKIDWAVDLEGLANHRGSSFGKQLSPQPTQINFENNLAYALIQHRQKGYAHILLEDEGKHVGKCMLPIPLAQHYDRGELVLLEVPLQARVQITLEEYVTVAQRGYISAYGEAQAYDLWAEQILGSLDRIKNRLGGDRLKQIRSHFQIAYEKQLATGKTHLHEAWIELLLRDYYDPMYNYQIKQTTKKIIFRGDAQSVEQFLSDTIYQKKG